MDVYQIHKPAPIESKPLKKVTVEVPVPKEDELLIKISVCGVCRTDLHIAEGDLKNAPYPIIPGHQVVGYVEQVGAKITTHQKGDRVGVAWLGSTCQHCAFCLKGQENLCPQSQYTGFDYPGGYAPYITAKGDYVYSIPSFFTDEQAAPLLCAGIIGFRSYLKSKISKGEKLGLYGFGSSAHLIAQLAIAQGCELYVATRNEKHQALAKQLGALEVSDGTRPFEEKVHSSIIFAPAGELVPVALQSLLPGGTCALAGIHMSEVPSMDYEHCLFHEKNLCSVEANTREDGHEFLKWAEKIKLKPSIHLFSFDQANEALIQLKQDAFQGSAVLKISG